MTSQSAFHTLCPITDPHETVHERHRRSIRLRGYDYSENGAYFVTICTNNREHLFGEIKNGEMWLNDIGNIVQQCWSEIPSHYPFVVLDAFVIMPNHIHGILIFENDPVSDPVRANHHSPDPAFEFMFVPAIGCRVNENGNGCRANDNSPLQEEQKRPNGTSGTVGSVIRGFKIGVTRWCRAHARTNVPRHRNYYERIIRDDGEWNAFREYIEKNPEMRKTDELNLPEEPE